MTEGAPLTLIVCHPTSVIRHETVFLFSLVGGLSHAHRAQPQGRRVRDRACSPDPERRRAACTGISRRESAEAGAGAGAGHWRSVTAIARHHGISRRGLSRPAAAAEGPDRTGARAV